MFQKRNQRIERWNAQARTTSDEPPANMQFHGKRRVSDVELFKTMGITEGNA
jgi:hypothetical protein